MVVVVECSETKVDHSHRIMDSAQLISSNQNIVNWYLDVEIFFFVLFGVKFHSFRSRRGEKRREEKRREEKELYDDGLWYLGRGEAV